MDEHLTPRAWTWADQVSSYRFWGLVGAWVCVAFSMAALRTAGLDSARQGLGFGYAEVAQIMAVGLSGGMVFGIVMGLLVLRGHTVALLTALALLCGVWAPLVLQGAMEPSLPTLTLSLWVGQALLYAFMVAVPAVLAGGLGGTLAFGAAFAVALLLKSGVDLVGPAAIMYLPQRWDGLSPMVLCVGPMVLAVGLLLPLWQPGARALFAVPPVPRHYPLTPRYRSPLGIALRVGLLWVAALMQLAGLWLQLTDAHSEGLPLLWDWVSRGCALAGVAALVHWNYRIHGEVAALAPSPQLLTPRAAGWASLLMPLAGLLLPLQLASVLNQRQRGQVSIGWLVCWSALLTPIAVAQLQRAVNRAVNRAAAQVDTAAGAQGAAPAAGF